MNYRPLLSVLRAVRSVGITIPASRKARAATLADACRIYGLGLDDDDRADRPDPAPLIRPHVVWSRSDVHGYMALYERRARAAENRTYGVD